MRGKCDPSRARDTRVDDLDDRGGLPDSGGAVDARLPLSAGAQPRDTPASSRRDRDHRPHRSRRSGDKAGRFSGEGACPRRRSSGGPLQLDVQPKPWHNRQDGLGVSEPEAVTRARRISPGPHPQSAQTTSSTLHQTNGQEGVDGVENRTDRGFPHRPQPRAFLGRRNRKDQRQERPDEHRPDLRGFR